MVHCANRCWDDGYFIEDLEVGMEAGFDKTVSAQDITALPK